MKLLSRIPLNLLIFYVFFTFDYENRKALTASVVLAQDPAACQEDYSVQADDWLSKIAEKFYGDVQAYPAIFDATNAIAATDSSYATIADPNVIEVGQKLCIPAGDKAMMDGAMAETPADAGPTATMTSAKGETFTLSLKTLPDSRDYIYCELVFDYGAAGQDIYSTSPIAPCDTDWWDNLDVDAVAAELGANSVLKNGPQWWSMDEVGVMVSEPVTIAGVSMNFGAVLPAGTGGTPHYQVFNTAKFQNLTYDAGKPAYQLVDPDGNVYVLQGNKIPSDQLATLGSQFQSLPEGWQYIVVTPSSDLVLNLTPDAPIPSVQDEFDQIYIRIPLPSETLTTASGQDVTISLQLLPDSRGYIYCEIVFDYGAAGQDIYSTSPVAPCNTDWWDNLDMAAVAAELGADRAIKNGPQRWAMDEEGGMVSAEPTTIAGVPMVYAATLPAGTAGGTQYYQIFNTAKTQFLLFEAGQPTYQLVDPDGFNYILQGYKVETDQLATLGDQFQSLPEGWQYQVVTLTEPLALSLSTNQPIPSVQDEFDQIYIRLPQ